MPRSRTRTGPKAPRKKKGEPGEVASEQVVDGQFTPDGEATPAPAGPEPEAEAGAEGEPDGPQDGELEEVEVDERTTALAKADEKALRSRDPLAAYMAEVQRHPLLSREEELALAQRYKDTGDLRAAAKLVASNLRLVVKLAHEYHRNPLSLLDLIQEGNIGLMQAVKKFDPSRGVKLASYAAWWIRAYILRYIMDNWKLVKLGTTEAQRKLFFKLRQEQDRLQAQGFEVTPKLLAERLNVSEKDVVEMDQRLGHDELSLDAPINAHDDDQTTRADRLLPSQAVSADVRLGDEQLKQLFKTKLARFAETLNEKERYIFEKRLTADQPLTLQDIGAFYGVSRERARQIEAALMARMKEYMRREIPDFDLQTLDED